MPFAEISVLLSMIRILTVIHAELHQDLLKSLPRAHVQGEKRSVCPSVVVVNTKMASSGHVGVRANVDAIKLSTSLCFKSKTHGRIARNVEFCAHNAYLPHLCITGHVFSSSITRALWSTYSVRSLAVACC